MNRFTMTPAETAAFIEERRKNLEDTIARAVGIHVDVSVSVFPSDNDNETNRTLARAAARHLGWKITRSRRPYARSLYTQSKTRPGTIGRTCIYTDPPELDRPTMVQPTLDHLNPDPKPAGPTGHLILLEPADSECPF